MDDEQFGELLTLTAEIVSAHVASNSVHGSELPALIKSVHGALSGLGASEATPIPEAEHKPAVSARKSLADDSRIISMIDGKSYKTLRRHLRTHGLTDKDYRARYDLPADYPMVAKAYSAARSAAAQARGFGRKVGEKVAQAAGAVETTVEEAVKPAAKRAKRGAEQAKAPVEPAAKPATRRGRKADA